MMSIEVFEITSEDGAIGELTLLYLVGYAIPKGSVMLTNLWHDLVALDNVYLN